MNTDYACRLADTLMKRFPRVGLYPFKDWSYPQKVNAREAVCGCLWALSQCASVQDIVPVHSK